MRAITTPILGAFLICMKCVGMDCRLVPAGHPTGNPVVDPTGPARIGSLGGSVPRWTIRVQLALQL